MNNAQVKYARERASDIFRNRKASLKVKFTTGGVKLTTGEKVQALREGNFTIVDTKGKPRYDYLSSYIEFPQETDEVYDERGHKEAESKLTQNYHRLMDELMLGDNQEALELLKAFENDQ